MTTKQFESEALHMTRCFQQSERWTLGRLTAQCSARWPDATAVYDARGSVTFAELEQRCARQAGALRNAGVRSGDRVAILGRKDIETVVAILAVARVGATYVPLDPDLPRRRLGFMLQDAACCCVVGHASDQVLADGYRFLCVDLGLSHAGQPGGLAFDIEPEQVEDDAAIAYIMYTSGSTGYPKGVMIEHRAILAFFHAHNVGAAIGPADRCMNTGPFHFDVSLLDTFLPLYFGASVLLTPALPLPKLLLSAIERFRITHFYAVGTVLGLMTGDGSGLEQHDLSSLRVLQTGAEVCNPRVVNAWLERWPRLEFINSYGPTEVTVGCCYYHKREPGLLSEDEAVPIGALHPGCAALLLDSAGRVLDDICAEGELVVGGEQVMRGYWGRMLEEQRAFVHIGATRYYRTGDIVRRDAQQVLHYVGRRDHELKIDGCRVHLNELKRCLERNDLIASAIVGTMASGGSPLRIGAAIVPRKTFGAQEVAQLLSDIDTELPAPFVPRAFLVCRRLPRLASGKVDASACMTLLARLSAGSSARMFDCTASDPFVESSAACDVVG